MQLRYTFIYFLISTLICISNLSFAQNKTIDSLLNLVDKEKNDTIKVGQILLLCKEYRKLGLHESGLKYCNQAIVLSGSIKVNNKIGWIKGISESTMYKGNIYMDFSKYDEALKYYFSALKLAQAISNKELTAHILNQIGTTYYYNSKFNETEEYYSKSLQLRIEINNTEAIADSYNNIGNVFYIQANYNEALKNYLVALKIYNKIKNTKGAANAYTNIGNIYNSQNNTSEALNNYNAALKTIKETKDKYVMGNIYNNIGYTYLSKGDYDKALSNFYSAQQIGEEIQNELLISYSCLNMGNIYLLQNKLQAAMSNFETALRINRKINNSNATASTLLDIGDIYIKLKNYTKAKEYFIESLNISKQIGAKEVIKSSYLMLSKMDSLQNKWDDAYKHHKLYIIYKDSIDSEEISKKTLKTTMAYEFEQKQTILKAEQEKKDAIEATNRKKQQTILLLVSISLLLLFLFLIVLLRTLKTTKKQKLIIEEKNKDIIDSINYAKRIQDALLKNEKDEIEKFPKHFVFFKPKDIVSGDFYWMCEKEKHWYIAVADCTGHGVPGAFMSMLGIAFLNEITANSQTLTPAEILNQLREKIVKELGQNNLYSETKDGMDISLIRLTKDKDELQWSGANNPLYLIHESNLTIIKPDKQPIGYHFNMKPFTNHTIPINTSDTLYLLTDGFIDQFGGAKGKKFMAKRFEEHILSIVNAPLNEQKTMLEKEFNAWKGELEQVDDVCVFGLKI
jgi:tetratricopeptide (TPR) repeat protein